MKPDTCLVDDCVNPPRVLPDPIPEGTEVMFSEMAAGRGLYCAEHFEEAPMSDRPEPGLIVCAGVDHLHCGREATPAQLLVAIREGVESGTIEGKMVFVDFGQSILTDLPGLYLVIPIDGEEA